MSRGIYVQWTWQEDWHESETVPMRLTKCTSDGFHYVGVPLRVFVTRSGDSSICLPRGSEEKLRLEHAAQCPSQRHLFLVREEHANVTSTLGKGRYLHSRQGSVGLARPTRGIADKTSWKARPEVGSWAATLWFCWHSVWCSRGLSGLPLTCSLPRVHLGFLFLL